MNPSFDPTQIPLRDIHLPDAVLWWPLAFGWWILVALVVLSVTGFAAWLYATRRHRAARRALRSALDAVGAGEDPVACAQLMSATMRRFAMTIDDQDLVAGLVGERWLAFLDQRWDRESFLSGVGRALLSAPYMPPGHLGQEGCHELGLLCIAWVEAQPVRT